MASDNEKSTDWQQIRITGGDGDTHAQGAIDLATGIESAPCFMCRSWEKDEKKLADHFRAHECIIEPNGTIQTPIIKDFPGRKSMKMRLQDMGWCRKDLCPTDDLATCNNFQQVATRADMLARMSLRDRVRRG